MGECPDGAAIDFVAGHAGQGGDRRVHPTRRRASAGGGPGGSNGDIPMLRFAGAGDVEPLRLVVRHDDGEREMAYDAGAEDALEAGFTQVSMRDDWSAVFG